MGELNLIPYELKEKKNNRLRQVKYILVILSTLILITIAVAIPSGELFALQKQKNMLDSEILSNNSVLVENKKITSQIQSINQYVNEAGQLSKQRVVVGSRIKGLGKYMPGDISIQSLGDAAGIITITGSTKNYNSISLLVTNLQTSKEYRQAMITNINYDEQQVVYSFSITID